MKFINKVRYDITPWDYLKRARKHLRSDRVESIFYAALELRCAIEARAREQLLSCKNISRKAQRMWAADKIMQELEKQINGAKYSFIFNIRYKNRNIRPFIYSPIDKEILTNYGKLGNLLHSQKTEISSKFVLENKKWMEDIFYKVVESCKGHMSRPPEWRVKCSKCNQYLTWEEIHKNEKNIMVCKCGHSGSLIDKEFKSMVTVKKKSKRTVELCQIDSFETEM